MFEFRQVLVRMRQGDSDRDLARARLIGRRKAREIRQLAQEHGYPEMIRVDNGPEFAANHFKEWAN